MTQNNNNYGKCIRKKSDSGSEGEPTGKDIR